MQEFKNDLNGLLFYAHITRAELARTFGIAPRNISRWNTHGIPQYAIEYLQLRAELISLRKQLEQMQKSPRD